jgi:hypothetical protein
MATDLDAILSGDANPTPAPTPEPETPTGTPPDHEREERFDDEILDDGWEDGQGDAKPQQPGEKQPSSPPEEDGETQGRVPVAALREERRKRQELEKRLAALEQPNQDQGPVDPVRQRLDLSVEYAREQFPDYETAETVFIEEIQKHPRGREIYQAMLEDRHPARFAYQVGQQLLALREIGDPRTFRDRVLAEAKAATKPQPPTSRPSLPQTLAASRDTGGRFASRDSAAPTPLSEIIAR